MSRSLADRLGSLLSPECADCGEGCRNADKHWYECTECKCAYHVVCAGMVIFDRAGRKVGEPIVTYAPVPGGGRMSDLFFYRCLACHQGTL